MPAWGWVLIAVAIVVVLAAVAWRAYARRRTGQLQERFGPEYDRTVDARRSRRQGEAELAEREKRRDELDIRPLSQAARARYIESWQAVQSQFVDDPSSAVDSADRLIRSVMEERGYPVDGFEQRAADLSVDHPHVVENYREGHRLAQQTAAGTGTTEDLRQAMRHYRALFEELVEPPADGAADQPLDRERLETEPDTARDRSVTRGGTAR
jgi:hypothetical protein